MVGHEEKKILVRALGSESTTRKHDCGGDVGIVKQAYNRLEFHLVDLKQNKLYCNCLPPLLDCVMSTSQEMVVVGQTAYLLGGRPPNQQKKSVLDCLKLDPTAHSEFYTGASLLDFKNGLRISKENQRPKWVPMSVDDRWYPRCTSLNGVLYNFGGDKFNPEVFNPSSNEWQPLHQPEELDGFRVSKSVLPDNNRIILHLSNPESMIPGCLYAFYPETSDHTSGEWECLDAYYPLWGEMGAVADSVIYTHCRVPELLIAYDTHTGSWLDVHWSAPPLINGHDVRSLQLVFDALLLLADRLLCLACYSPKPQESEPTKTFIMFLKFRVTRIGNGVLLSPEPSLTYQLPYTAQVRSYTLLQEGEETTDGICTGA